jgi:hypothetical protein
MQKCFFYLILILFHYQNLKSQYSLNKGNDCIYLKDFIYIEIDIEKEIYYQDDFVSFEHKYYMKVYDYYNQCSYKIGLLSLDSINIYPVIINDKKNGILLEFDNKTGILEFNYFENGIQVNTSFSLWDGSKWGQVPVPNVSVKTQAPSSLLLGP